MAHDKQGARGALSSLLTQFAAQSKMPIARSFLRYVTQRTHNARVASAQRSRRTQGMPEQTCCHFRIEIDRYVRVPLFYYLLSIDCTVVALLIILTAIVLYTSYS